MDLEQRAIDNCLEYDAVKIKIDDISKRIGKHIGNCMKNSEVWHELRGKKVEEEDYEEPCVFVVYKERTKNHYRNTGPEYNHVDFESTCGMCEECSKAHELIQERKELRQEFGIAKRKIRATARAIKKQQQ